MSDNVLIDTNIWVYLYALNQPAKRENARQLIEGNFQNIVVSSQILGELYHVLTRKGFQDPASAREIVAETVGAFPVSEIGAEHVLEAMSIHQHYGYSYWDSLVIATAVLNGCSSIYSEDMQHGQVIEDKVQIINPFISSLGQK
mgnify:CR=1 FL=1